MIHSPGSFQITLKLFLCDLESQIEQSSTNSGNFINPAEIASLLVLKDRGTGQGDLPGGRLNHDEIYEPFELSLAREVKEELGDVSCEIYPDPIFIFPHFVEKDQADALGVAYIGRFLRGGIQLSEEHTQYSWRPLEALVPESMFVHTMLAAVQRFHGQRQLFLDRLKSGQMITLP
ncbi:MAG: NUDIX hydrolase [Leptospiraceae bacterium]